MIRYIPERRTDEDVGEDLQRQLRPRLPEIQIDLIRLAELQLQQQKDMLS